MVAHAAFVGGRLKTPPAGALYDVLELFAFVRPGAPCVPSALGLARVLGLALPHSPEASARVLREGGAASARGDRVQRREAARGDARLG